MSPAPPGYHPPAPFVVAIDGPAASGKGTLAHRLASRFGLAHLDTGRLYRAAALILFEEGGDPGDAAAAERAARRVDAGLLDDPRLTEERVAAASSRVAALPEVRAALLAFQRGFAAHPPPGRGAVLDGRDIGSVVCPHAQVKLFVTARVEERARRRVAELRARGDAAIYEDVLQDLNQRDTRDSNRPVAPLAAAPDAVVIDTTALDVEEVFERAARLVSRALKEKEWLQNCN